MKFELIVTPLPGDLVQIMAHKSCKYLTSLSISQLYSPEVLIITNELFRRLTLHHDDSACTHLKSLTLYCQSSEASLPALLDMVRSRIGYRSRAGQPSEGLLHALLLHINDFDLNDEQKLNRIVKRSAMEYEMKERDSDGVYSAQLVRRGFRAHV